MNSGEWQPAIIMPSADHISAGRWRVISAESVRGQMVRVTPSDEFICHGHETVKVHPEDASRLAHNPEWFICTSEIQTD
jgi:hypothetical protein